MKRVVEPELLDELPPHDPRALRSRRDLRRVNGWMRNPAIMARALQTNLNGHALSQIADLGAGDGRCLLRVAQKIAPRWPDVDSLLLDRQPAVSAATLAAFARLGWRARAVVADVFDWVPDAGGVVVANLFLHHFKDERLAGLLRAVAGRAALFVAVEPRRFAWPHLYDPLLWLIGCNAVTRHDGRVSIRAGFAGRELSALWPDRADWQLAERSAGLFSHLFIARKIP